MASLPANPAGSAWRMRIMQPAGVHGAMAPRGAGHQPPGIDRMEAVDVLLRPDCLDHRRLVEMGGQRQLHQDAVDRRIGVERLHDRQQFGLAGRRRQRLLHRMEAEFGRLLALAGDIDRACRIVADQHHREAGDNPRRRLQALGLALDGLR